jgi:hypothetical protein
MGSVRGNVEEGNFARRSEVSEGIVPRSVQTTPAVSIWTAVTAAPLFRRVFSPTRHGPSKRLIDRGDAEARRRLKAKSAIPPHCWLIVIQPLPISAPRRLCGEHPFASFAPSRATSSGSGLVQSDVGREPKAKRKGEERTGRRVQGNPTGLFNNA